MANDRTFYACQAVNIQPLIFNPATSTFGSGSFTYIHGVQSVGLNTNFDIENIFELGQIEIYDNVLKIPSIEVTLEKVLDDHPSIYTAISSGTSLLNASKNRTNLRFGIYKDTTNAASGASPENTLLTLECTGMYVNSVSYTFPSDGSLTESVTLVGNHKAWAVSGSFDPSGEGAMDGLLSIPGSVSGGIDTPLTHVLNRKDVSSIVAPHGNNKVQSITLSVDLGREDLLELGQQGPYARVPTYPVEVTAEIEYLVDEDNMEQIEFDENTSVLPEKDQSISVGAGYYDFDLGDKCFLKSVTFGGGDATGGNATVTYSYSTYNTFQVTYTNPD
jgi:hypothetical protein